MVQKLYGQLCAHHVGRIILYKRCISEAWAEKIRSKPVPPYVRVPKIVVLLGKCAGKVLTYDYIIKELWGPGTRGNNQSLRVHMANIRRKIEKNPGEPEYIFTEIGVGYRMVEAD